MVISYSYVVNVLYVTCIGQIGVHDGSSKAIGMPMQQYLGIRQRIQINSTGYHFC